MSEVEAEQRHCHTVPVETGKRSPAGQWTVVQAGIGPPSWGVGGRGVSAPAPAGWRQVGGKHLGSAYRIPGVKDSVFV